MLEIILALIAFPALAAAALAVLFVRRAMLTRGGTIAMAMRISHRVAGRGWAPGFAKFDSGQLAWYRMFSYSPRPRRMLHRGELKVEQRRDPLEAERQIFPPTVVILCCQSPDGLVELAMTRTALTGFLSWLEAAPPGAASELFD